MDTNATIYKLMGSFQNLLVANQGHSYASGYLGSFAATIAQNLGEAEKAEFLADLADRIAEQTKTCCTRRVDTFSRISDKQSMMKQEGDA